MLKAILFDLDNTLIDFMGMKKNSMNESIKEMKKAGLRISEKKANSILYKLYIKYGIEHNQIFQKFVLETTGKKDMKIISAGIVSYRFAQSKYRKPYKNVVPTLKKLKKKYKLGIVSDAPSLKAWIRLQELGIVDYFDVVVAHESAKKLKPHGFPFRKALRQLKLKPDEILFVGDQPLRDIKGAKALGMKTALAEYGIMQQYKKYVKENKPDFKLKNISDILKIVKEI